MAKNAPNLANDINVHIQKMCVQETAKMIHLKKSTSRLIIVQLLKSKGQGRVQRGVTPVSTR
jgi:hypothetical protein